jgi:hypothetical protein
MADELAYSSNDLYGQYGYEGGQNVTFSALDAIISNLKVSSAQIENLAVETEHVKELTLQGNITIIRPDGYKVIINGTINQSFDIQGSDPPGLVDVTIQPGSRFFETNSTTTNGGTCNIYTFTRQARYVVFQVAIMSSSSNQSTAILVESGAEDTWLASVSAFDTTETVKTFYVDLGVPDGSQFALKLLLKSYSTTNTAYCRKIRAYQTDFLPQGV